MGGQRDPPAGRGTRCRYRKVEEEEAVGHSDLCPASEKETAGGMDSVQDSMVQRLALAADGSAMAAVCTVP